ncbi:MAG: universal stress protein [Bacillota bacterium]
MYKKILVPLDGSFRASIAAEQAVQLAKLMNSEVMFLHVIPSISPYVGQYAGKSEGAYEQIHNDLQNIGEEILRKAMEDFGSYGVSLDAKKIWGNPAAEICREAKEGRYDLIVMSSRGLGEVKGYLMGSTSNRVVRHALCPVLIVR